MMRLLLSFILVMFSFLAIGQTVENIRVEQEGDKLNIFYRIGGSTSEETYFVTLTCSIDGGPAFEPKSTIGDVGPNIAGGKSFNTIQWDVFSDIEEIGEVEFFVKVELEGEKDESPAFIAQKPEKNEATGLYRRLFAGYDGSTIHPLGLRVGMVGNWGFYAAFRSGGYDPFYDDNLLALTGGVTKRIYDWGNFRIHGYTGFGIGDYLDEPEFELGAIGVIKNRVNLNLGFTTNPWYADVTFGVGIVF